MERLPLTTEAKKESRFDRMLGILKKSVVVGMIGLATSQSAENRLGTYIGHLEDTHIERVDKDREKRPVSIEDLQNMILHDESERMFVGGHGALYEVGGGERESGFIKFSDVQRFINEGENSPVVAHTHPLSIFDNAGYTAEELKKIRTEGDSSLSMPPSITDIMGSINTIKHFQDQEVEIHERVYDPSGVWEYAVQQDNSSVEQFEEFLQDLSGQIEASITETDKQTVKALGIEMDKIHPAKRISILKADPRTATIGEKLERTANSFVEELPDSTKETLTRFAELEGLCLDIAGAKIPGHDGEKAVELINDYIKTAASVGIQVSYTPNRSSAK